MSKSHTPIKTCLSRKTLSVRPADKALPHISNEGIMAILQDFKKEIYLSIKVL